MDWTRIGLEGVGFTGFVPFAALPESDVPCCEGIYVVYRTSDAPPAFRSTSDAGRFKGRNPSVAVVRLQSKWIDDVPVVYIGKATARSAKRGLRRRLHEYRRHGLGEKVGHWGGRFVWQLADAGELLVAWRPCPDATAEERQLLDAFVEDHGRLPFANLRR